MSKGKLLLADDSITIQKVVNLTFADKGIEVITVGDGDTALNIIGESEPDIVLLDVNMPGLSGYQLCEIIRENEATKDLSVILLVGSFEPFDEEEAQRVGASAWLTKPFKSIRELVSKVLELLTAAEEMAKQPETEDIENLYKESFSETSEVRDDENPTSNFADDGFDDEMIETSYAVSDGENSDDLDFGTAFPEDTNEATTIEFEHKPSEQDSGETGANVEYSSPFDAPAYDDLQAEAAPEVEETYEQAVYEATVVEDQEMSVSELAAAQTLSFDRIQLELSHPSLSFENIDLLELPGVNENKALEFATPAGTVAAGQNKQVVSISPELMEIIVQKVVEKIAEKY